MVETQLDLPFSVEDCGGLNAIYVDQAPSHNRFGYASFFTCYTPHGIHAIDNEFIRRIVHFRGTRKQRQALRNEIIHNPHLHGVIKRNLLETLDSR